jgi:Tfp pilus assembly protein PilZ
MIGDYILVVYLFLLDSYVWLVITSWYSTCLLKTVIYDWWLHLGILLVSSRQIYMVGDYILVVYLSLLDRYIWLVITSWYSTCLFKTVIYGWWLHLGSPFVSSRQLYMIGDYILVFYLSLQDSYIWLVITYWYSIFLF